MPSIPVPVLSFLFVSFRPSLLRSHSRSTGACLPLSPPAFPLSLRFLSSPSVPVLTTQPAVLPFPSSWPRLTSGFSSARLRLSASPSSTFSSTRFPVLPFRLLVLGFLSVSFRPSRLRFPQLFHRCFPSFPLPLVRFTSGLSACLPLSFVCFGLLLTTQPSALSFPLFPFSPVGGSHGARRFLSSPTLSSSVQPVSMPSFRFRYSASCDSFLRLTASCHRHFTAPGLLFPARPSPLLSL